MTDLGSERIRDEVLLIARILLAGAVPRIRLGQAY